MTHGGGNGGGVINNTKHAGKQEPKISEFQALESLKDRFDASDYIHLEGILSAQREARRSGWSPSLGWAHPTAAAMGSE